MESGPGGVEAETRQSLNNLTAILEAAGSSMGLVLKTTVFLRDMADFAKMNAVYGEFFPDEPPARSTVQVAALPKGGAVEIEAVAALLTDARGAARRPSMAGELILVVDDEAHIVDLVRLYLEREGFRVDGASDGAQGLRLRARSSGADRARPDAARGRRLRSLPPGACRTRTCRSSCSPPATRTSTRSSAWSSGADDYLTKPFNPRELVARVKAILRRADSRGRRRPRRAAPSATSPSTRRAARCASADRGWRCATKEFDLLAGASPRRRASSSRASNCWTASGATTSTARRAPSTCTSRHLRKRLAGSPAVEHRDRHRRRLQAGGLTHGPAPPMRLLTLRSLASRLLLTYLLVTLLVVALAGLSLLLLLQSTPLADRLAWRTLEAEAGRSATHRARLRPRSRRWPTDRPAAAAFTRPRGHPVGEILAEGGTPPSNGGPRPGRGGACRRRGAR